MFEKRVTLLVGHFGSGKTEIALNGALDLVGSGRSVSLVDLDVVKPYFRSRSGRALLAEQGVDLVAPPGDNIYADLPIVVPAIRELLRREDGTVLMDVGGDETGARVLGSLSDVIRPAETDCLLVLNFRRPFTRNVDEAEAMIRGIETVARMKVTGLVSNTHLMDETTPEIVREGFRLARETADRVGTPVVAVCASKPVLDRVSTAGCDCARMVLERIVRPPFEKSPHVRPNGPLFVLN